MHTDNQTKESLFNKMVSEGPQGTYDLKVSLYGSTFSIELNVKKQCFISPLHKQVNNYLLKNYTLQEHFLCFEGNIVSRGHSR